MQKRYDQAKLATTLQKIAEDVVHFWKKYGGIGMLATTPILMQCQQKEILDTIPVEEIERYEIHPEGIRVIAGENDGKYTAIFQGRDFPVVAIDNRWLGIIPDDRIIFIKIRSIK